MVRARKLIPVLPFLFLGAATARAAGAAAEVARPAHGFLGVMLVDEDGADGVAASGVRIGKVHEDSAAARAGLREGDRVIAVDGRAVSDAGDVVEAISGRKPGDTVTLKLRRDGQEIEQAVTLGERPAGSAFGHRMFLRELGRMGFPGGKVRLGVELQPMSDGLRGYFKVPAGQGVLVGDVVAGSPAEKAGVKPGDVILKVNDREVASHGDVLEALSKLEPGDRATLVVMREGADQTIDVTVEERPREKASCIGFGRDFDVETGGELLTPEMKDELHGLMTPEVQQRVHEALEQARRQMREKGPLLERLRMRLRGGEV